MSWCKDVLTSGKKSVTPLKKEFDSKPMCTTKNI